MKTKKIRNKLELNKKTIANLGTESMRSANGGKPGPTGAIACPSYLSFCCPTVPYTENTWCICVTDENTWCTECTESTYCYC